MKKWSLRWLILLITLALSGLVILQLRWVNEAIKLKEQRFDQSVVEMMMTVSKKIEMMDALNNMRPIMTPVKESNTIAITMRDSVDENMKPVQGDDQMAKGYYIQKNIDIRQSQTILVNDVPPLIPHEFKKIIHLGDKPDNYKGMIVGNDTVFFSDSLLNDYTYAFYSSELNKYTDVFRQLAFDMLDIERPLEQRVDRIKLDSLLEAEMNIYGLNTKYNYGIWESDQEKYILVSDESKLPPALADAKYKVGLFRTDPFYNNGYLTIDFPNKSNYLLRSMSLQLGSSLLFILLIVGGFAYTIVTILRQKRLSDMKTDFINNMTHELKTPVATISLASEMIQRESKNYSSGSVKKFADIIFDENKRLAQQVDKVLQIAALEKEDYHFKKSSIDLHKLIATEAEKFSFRIQNREGQIETQLNANEHIIFGDELHLRNIIDNLLDNADKYTATKPAIKISTQNKNGSILIAVDDNGIGMTRDQQKKIFEKFYRVNTGDLHNVQGFGLGLSYVKHVTEKHGGEITVHSTPGNGSRFEIILPIENHKSKN